MSVPAVPGVLPPKDIPIKVVVGSWPITVIFLILLFWAPFVPDCTAITAAEVPTFVFWNVNWRNVASPPTKQEAADPNVEEPLILT